MRGIPSFLFVDSNSSCKDLFSPHDPNLAQKPLYLVGTVLNFDPRRTLSFYTIIWSVTPPTVSNINKCSQIYGGGGGWQIKLVVTRFQKARKRTELRANAKNKEQREKVRWFLHSPPLPGFLLILGVRAPSLIRSLVRSLRLEQERAATQASLIRRGSHGRKTPESQCGG